MANHLPLKLKSSLLIMREKCVTFDVAMGVLLFHLCICDAVAVVSYLPVSIAAGAFECFECVVPTTGTTLYTQQMESAALSAGSVKCSFTASAIVFNGAITIALPTTKGTANLPIVVTLIGGSTGSEMTTGYYISVSGMLAEGSVIRIQGCTFVLSFSPFTLMTVNKDLTLTDGSLGICTMFSSTYLLVSGGSTVAFDSIDFRETNVSTGGHTVVLSLYTTIAFLSDGAALKAFNITGDFNDISTSDGSFEPYTIDQQQRPFRCEQLLSCQQRNYGRVQGCVCCGCVRRHRTHSQ